MNHIKINATESLVIILIFISLSCASLARENLYYDALREIKYGNTDFAFMKLNNYLRECPDSIHTQKIRFAIAEYYFQIQDHHDAIYRLTEYIKDYQEDKSTVFAWALLYKIISDYNKEPLLIEKIKEKFFAKSLFLIFSDSKVKHYRSILNNTYKIAEYVNKIEISKNDELLLKITP